MKIKAILKDQLVCRSLVQQLTGERIQSIRVTTIGRQQETIKAVPLRRTQGGLLVKVTD